MAALLLAVPLSSCVPSSDEQSHAAPSVAPAVPAAMGSPVGSPSPGYEAPLIQAAELKRKLDAKEKVLILDVRSPQAYAREHIPGAKSVPWSKLPEEHKKLPKDWLMALYCT
ncbi:MAG: rhodanese-like domain-containing protein [Candidatus Sericytochromatia bacterium]